MVDPTCSDLATKAELQELRDQLNAVLGEKEEGGTVEVFQAGVAPLVATQAAGATAYAVTKTRAAQSIADIVLQNPQFEPIYRDFANGNATWTKVSGSGARSPLPDLGKLGKVSGQAAGAGAGAATVAATATASMALMVGLVNIVGTLALNIATVKILDKRIDAEARGTQQSLDSLNNGMLRLYSKNQEDIDAVQQQLNENASITEQNRQTMEEVRFKANEAINKNQELNSELDQANNAIVDLQSKNQQLAQDILDYNADYEETTENLTQTITEVDTQLQTAVQIIETQKQTIQQVELDIAEVNTKTDGLESRVTEVEEETQRLKVQFEKLGIDLQADITEVDERVDDLEGKIILTQKYVKQQRTSGGASGAAATGAAAAQTGLLDLTAKLANTTNTETVSTSQIFNQPSRFPNVFAQLLNLVQPNIMDEQQIEGLKTDIDLNTQNALNLAIATLLTPTLNDLTDRTSLPHISDGVQKGICESLNSPTPCQGTNATQGLKGLGDALKNKADALLAAMGAADLAQGQSILTIVRSTNEVVTNVTTGVKAIGEGLAKAWKASGADKILNAISTAMVIHNGIMLSNNLLGTVGDTASIVLEAVGIKDSNNEAFDVNSILKAKLTSLVQRVVGAENYATLSANLANANRIYQAGANVLDASRDLFDSARSTAELTASNTGKIGNALLESGVVSEDSYEEMIERVNPQSRALRRVQSFRERLDDIEEGVSTVSNIASEVVSVKDSYRELHEAQDEWRETNETVRQEYREQKEQEIAESQALTTPEESDFDAAPPNESESS